MTRMLIVVVSGVALFALGAWWLELFGTDGPTGPIGPENIKVKAESELGGFLYTESAFPTVKLPQRPKDRATDPIVLHGVMNPRDLEEVSSQVNGRVLFIGEEIDPEVAAFAGSAPLIAEPFYPVRVQVGDEKTVLFYRRLYDGQVVELGQLVGMLDPSKALGQVMEKSAKIEVAKAENAAAEKTEAEAKVRYEIAGGLYAKRAMTFEDYRAARLTWDKTVYEHAAKFQAVELAKIDRKQAVNELRQHEMRPLLPHTNMVIKSIQKQQGAAVKQGDPILTVQNLERLQAEAQIELAYFARLRPAEKKASFTATIEPTILDSPLLEYPAHNKDVSTLAVTKDMRVVSGSDDHTVCVWTLDSKAPHRKMEHDAGVTVVACSPATAANNLCLAGCKDGTIYVWNLDEDAGKPIKILKHGSDIEVTSVAFSPDGAWFASGASNGSINLWSTNEAKLQYSFTPEFGVAQPHEDAVTSLHFTPQSRLVSAARDKTLRVWRLRQKGAAAEGSPIRDRGGEVNNLGVSKDGKWMLFDQGRAIKVYSVQSRNFVHTISTAANTTPFSTLALFSPDGSMILTAGAPEGRLQLWRTPDGNGRAFEARLFGSKSHEPVSCAAFSPEAGKGGRNSFAVSASGHNFYVWAIPTAKELDEQPISNVPLTLTSHNVDTATGQIRIGFEVPNPVSPRYPNGRFEAGRSVTIVID